MLVLTIDRAPGYRIVAVLGEVIGATVRPDNPYLEGVKSLTGKAPDTEEAVRSRMEAVVSMVQHARQKGANAVLGLRFDHRTVAGKWTEICAYGTAMVLAPRRTVRRTDGASRVETPGATQRRSVGTVAQAAAVPQPSTGAIENPAGQLGGPQAGVPRQP
ncbi:MAG TPA: heavy metal-binding domain-containing protein [Micromonosporaceae bacterium]|nr:heavy metal-binding domain-containing protein [Micromonosporaceae bacterium]